MEYILAMDVYNVPSPVQFIVSIDGSDKRGNRHSTSTVAILPSGELSISKIIYRHNIMTPNTIQFRAIIIDPNLIPTLTGAIEMRIMGQDYKNTFTVAEYVLPTFDVKVNAPSYATFNNSEVVVNIKASYTYGKGVMGELTLKAESNSHFYSELTPKIYEFKTKIKISYRDDTPLAVKEDDYLTIYYGDSYQEELWTKLEAGSVPETGIMNVEIPAMRENITILAMKAVFRGIDYYLPAVQSAVSPSSNYIRANLVSVDQENAEIEVGSTEPLSYLVYQVVSRGNIVSSLKMTTPSVTKYTFKIPVVQSMAPKATVLIYYIRKENNELIADAINFKVNGVFRTPVMEELETYDAGKKRPEFHYARKRRSLWWSGSSTAAEIFQESGLVVLTNAWVYEEQEMGKKQYNYYFIYRFLSWVVFVVTFRFNSDATSDQDMPYSNEAMVPELRSFFPETWLWNNTQAGTDGKVVISSKIPDTITSWVISAFAVDPVFGLGICDNTTKVTVFRPFFIKLNLPYSVVRGETLSLQVMVFNYNSKPITADVTLENGKEEFLFTMSGNEIDGPTKRETKTVTPEGKTHYKNRAILLDLRLPSTKSVQTAIDVTIPDGIVEGSESISISTIGDLLGPTINNMEQLLRLPVGCGEQNMLNFVPSIVVLEYLDRAHRLSSILREKALSYIETGYQRELTYQREDGSFSAFGKTDRKGSTWLTSFVLKAFGQASRHIDVDSEIIKKTMRWLIRHQREDGGFAEPGKVHNKAMQGASGNGVALSVYTLIALMENQNPPVSGKYAALKERLLLRFGRSRQVRTAQVSETKPIADQRPSIILVELSKPPPSQHCDPCTPSSNSLQHLEQSDLPRDMNVTTTAPKKTNNAAAMTPLHLQPAQTSVPQPLQPQNTLQQSSPPIEARVTTSPIPIAPPAQTTYAKEVGLATQFVEKEVENTSDPYILAIATYCLHLADSPAKDEAFGRLKQMAQSEGDMLYWPGGIGGPSQAIETTAYALMTYVMRGEASGAALPLVRWLISKQNENGGFLSTQDTVIAIQALAGVAKHLASPTISLTVHYSGGVFNISTFNAMILQKIMVSWQYNMVEDEKSSLFSLKPSIKNKNMRKFDLDICTHYIGKGEDKNTNMAVMEVGLPSGFQSDAKKLQSLINDIPEVKRVETRQGDSSVVIYFDKIDDKESCLVVPAYKTYDVANAKPAQVKIYDYYNL
ncbi:CD109, partial [Cordylochernes scorpioides]